MCGRTQDVHEDSIGGNTRQRATSVDLWLASKLLYTRAGPAVQSREPAPSLDDIVITPLLAERWAPARDIVVEHEALVDLIAHAASEPTRLLGRLVDLARHLCHAGSAGVSLLEPAAEPEDGIFRWVAMSGAYKEYAGGTTPQSFSPCGVCLSRGAAQLYRHPARLFTYLSQASPPIVEGLVLPLRSEAGPTGHDLDRVS